MPEGKVRDPEGHQSRPNGWGYIKRDDLDWPGEKGQKKVIPFKNPADESGLREFAKNDRVKFDIEYPELDGLTIGVAVNVELIEE